MQKVLGSTVLFVLLCVPLIAQRILTGTVTGDHEPLIGATITYQGTGTLTDINGQFSISDAPNTPFDITVSYTGFEPTQQTVLPKQAQLNIQLTLDPFQLQDVIVSANKKAQSIQTTPLAITAISPVQLRRTGARSFRDFASGIPNLAFGTQGSDGGGRYSNEISIRGISGINTTAMYLDETPLPESISPNLIDVTRVEILKGPQGTLYGSATMAGAVKIITNNPNPNQTEGMFSSSHALVAEGDTNHDIQGIFNQPLSKKMAVRISGYYNTESGVYDRVVREDVDVINVQPILQEDLYGDPIEAITDACPGCNLDAQENVDDRRSYGFNASLGIYPSKNWSIIPKVIHQYESGDGYDFAEGNVNNFTQTSSTGLAETFDDEWTHYSLAVEAKLDKGKIISSTSYLDRYYAEVEDVTDINTIWWLEYEDESIDAGDAVWAGDVERSVGTQLFQQELRYQSDFTGKFNFLAGLFYRLEQQDWLYLDERPGKARYLLSDNAFDAEECPDCAWEEAVVLNNLNSPWYLYDGLFEDDEIALFGQFYYDITPALKATFGFRYFQATQSKTILEDGADFGFIPLELTDNNSEPSFNPKFNLSYQISGNKMLYATAVR
ncbi:MAG: TonB-dependent receptor plug domain-containing protein, partial [Bacteroidota bacterium]